MNEINQENLDTAIVLGEAVCNELEICCDKRGRVIFQIYKKLEELKPRGDTRGKPETGESQPVENAHLLQESSETESNDRA